LNLGFIEKYLLLLNIITRIVLTFRILLTFKSELVYYFALGEIINGYHVR